jgi:hypothetical protein
MVYMSWLLLLVFVLRAFAIEDLQDEVDRLRCALILANINNSVESAISVKLKKAFKAQNGKIGALGGKIEALGVSIGARIGALDDRVGALEVKIGALEVKITDVDSSLKEALFVKKIIENFFLYPIVLIVGFMGKSIFEIIESKLRHHFPV